MTVASWARDLAANYRSAQFKDRYEQTQNRRRAIEFDDLAYQLELENYRDEIPSR